MIVVPWPLASSRTATSAVIADGLTGSPRSSTTKHAVGVAVEGQPDVGAVLADGGLQVDQVGRVQRVGLVVGEGAVELEVQRDDLQRQPGEDDGDGVPAHAVAGVDDDLQRPDAREVDQAVQVRGVLGEHVALGDLADAARARGRSCRARPTRGW